MTNGPGSHVPRFRDDTLVAIELSPSVGRAIAGDRRLEALDLSEVTYERMASLHGSSMACELFTPQGDALGIIAALVAAGATGHLTVIAPPLPDPIMVERELRAQADGFSVVIVHL
jgi:hypothetical protein